MTPRAFVVIVAVAVSAAACASSSAGTVESRPSRPAGERNVLMPDDLAKTSAQDVYRAIEIARPTWLRIRGTMSSSGRVNGSPDPVQVYIGAAHYGDVSSLRQLTVSSVAEVRYLDAGDATTRFGTGHGAGAIVIKLK